MTNEECQQFDHISNEEIQNDIDETIKELKQYKEENEIMSQNPQENRLKIYLNEGKIVQRETFINQLKTLQEYRRTK